MNLDRRRTIEPRDASTTRITRSLTQSLRLGVGAILSRIRPVPGLDHCYARPLRHYLRQSIQDRIEHAEAAPPGDIDPDGLQRYRRACARLLPSDRELIVGRLELG